MRSNYMAQLHGSTAENAVWVLPRSHRWGHLDIPQIIAQHGERVPGALPLITNPGDVAMCNRNCLHCSYPNTSDRTRITLNFGFHKRSAVDAAGELLRLPNGPDTVAEGDEVAAEIDRRCRAIPVVRHTFFFPPCACGRPTLLCATRSPLPVFAGGLA